MMRLRLFSRRILLSVCLLTFVTCKKEETGPTPRDYPRVSTLEVTEVTAAGASFHGDVFYPGASPITDHGFVWGTYSSPTVENADFKSLGQKEGKGPFSAAVFNSMIKGKKYTVRAYARSKDFVVYGPKVTFESQGSLASKITGFTPTTALWGDTVTISGEHFSNLKGNNTVKFGTTAATTVRATENQLKVVVPQELSETTVKLQVTVAEQISTSGSNFQLIAPTVSGFSPQAGTYGDLITFTGTNFGTTPALHKIYFNEKEARLVSVSRNKIEATVPSGLPPGKVSISLRVFGQPVEVQGEFESLAPTVTGISPAIASFGTLTTITGTNFSLTPQGNKVLFGQTEATVQSSTSTQLKVIVPSDLTLKSSVIAVTVKEQVAFSPQEFSLLPPVILDISPLKIDFGQPIIIKGNYFSPILENNEVRLGGFSASVIRASTTQLQVLPPTEINLPENRFSVTVAQQTSHSDQKLYTPWLKKQNLGNHPYDIPRREAAAFAIRDKIYVGTGERGNELNDLWEYDPHLNYWTQKADFQGKNRRAAVGFSGGNKGYVGMGSAASTGGVNDVWEYDPAVNQWTQKKDFPGPKLVKAISININGKAYVGTGLAAGEGITNQFWEYNHLSDTWTRKADFPGAARTGAVAFAIDGRGFVGTGTSGAVTGDDGYRVELLHKDFYEFNPQTNQWTRIADFPGAARLNAVAFTINNKGYVGTGIKQHSHPLRDIWEFNPETNQWAQKANFGGTPRQMAIGLGIGGKGFIGTGSAIDGYDFKQSGPGFGLPVSDWWEFDPSR